MKARRSRASAAWLLVCAALLPLGVTATPPSPPQGRRVYIAGRVQRSDGGPLGNFAVVAVEKNGGAAQWSMVQSACFYEARDDVRDLTLTGADGAFALSVWRCEVPESIAAAIVFPESLVVGDPVWYRDLLLSEFAVMGDYVDDGFFCDKTTSVVSSYEYSIEDALIPLP